MSVFDPSVQGLFWVLAIALTIIVLDVFFETEILSVTALVGISIYIALLFDVSAKWKILIALLCWLAVTGIFYAVWKRIFAPLIRRCFTSGADEAIHSVVGATGEFRRIDGKTFVRWNGDLWPVDLDPAAESADPTGFVDHQRVVITAVTGGIFSIAALSPSTPHPPS